MKIKKAADTEKCIIKRKNKFEDYKNCLEANRLAKEINCLEKNKLVVDVLRKNYNQFIKISSLILKSQKHNVFTEEVNKVAFSANHDERIQSIHWKEQGSSM